MSAIGRTWRTSSYSNSQGGDCVEVADTAEHGAAVRDTRHRESGHLVFGADAWTSFLRGLKSDRL